MDFGVLPPEVVSARIYAGPGPGSLMLAARAWSALAADLSAAVREFDSVIAALTGDGWAGPAAAAMAASATRYTTWMAGTTAAAEQAASRAEAAADAFEEVFAAVVAPPVILANRTELAALAAANTLGQNGAAIAALEAEYGGMWAQDQLAMSRYAGRSAAAATVTPFTSPPVTTNAPGPDGGSATAANLAAGGVHERLSGLINAIPRALSGLGSSPGLPGAPLAGGLEPLQSAALPSLSNLLAPVESVARSVLPANDANISVLYGQGQFARNLNFDLDAAQARAAAPANTASLGAVRATVSAGVGDAATVGRMAVPTRWVELTPAWPVAVGLADPGTRAAVGVGAPGALAADMALAGLAGRGIAGAPAPRRPAVEQNRLQQLAAELTGSPKVRHWQAGGEQARRMFGELAETPGVHTVHLDPGGGPESEPGRRPGRG